MSDEKTPAERLTQTMWPMSGVYEGAAVRRALDAGWMDEALALERGWTPPPNPHEDIARELWRVVFPGDEWVASEFAIQRGFIDAVRRMDLRRGDQ